MVIQRRHFLLLEVLIAFAFVVIAVLPLIYPHFYIYQQQHKFIEKIDLDIAVNEAYAVIMEQLYLNQISWDMIEQKQWMPINEQFWAKVKHHENSPFRGNFQLQIVASKENKEERYGNYLLQLNLQLFPKHTKTPTEKIENANALIYKIFVSKLFRAE